MSNSSDRYKLLEEFLNSDPQIVEAFYEKFNAIDDYGLTVPEYFNNLESELTSLDDSQYIELFSDYSVTECVDLSSEMTDIHLKNWLDVSVKPNEINYKAVNTAGENNYALAA